MGSRHLDAEHVWNALSYVERNPVRADLVLSAEEYRWSSAPARLGRAGRPEWLTVYEWERQYDAGSWRQVLEGGVADTAWRQRIREATAAGKPMGSDQFVRRIADDLQRDLTIRPPGRPRALETLAV